MKNKYQIQKIREKYIFFFKLKATKSVTMAMNQLLFLHLLKDRNLLWDQVQLRKTNAS